ncbi:MAG: HD domain-containing protein [Acidimicrobiia bacterium]|nr:HD domain-containing protein [Acidimicrobiia bacterium]
MDAHDTRADLHLSKRFFKATEWAAARHAFSADAEPASRPSLGQVLGIASLVLEDGGTEREAIAAMLLDAIGPDEAPLTELRSTFGKKTTKLVALCAQARADDDVEHRIERLDADGDPSMRRVFAADLLRELRALVQDLRRAGSIAFARFSTPPNQQLDSYQLLVQVLTRLDPRGSLTQELRATFAEMQRLVELDTATAAWRVAHVDAA